MDEEARVKATEGEEEAAATELAAEAEAAAGLTFDESVQEEGDVHESKKSVVGAENREAGDGVRRESLRKESSDATFLATKLAWQPHLHGIRD